MKDIKNTLTVPVVAGNIIFVLWILYNGINEGFAGTVLEKLYYIGLMGLLAVNTILLLTGRAKQSD
jgi:hypothetical protein